MTVKCSVATCDRPARCKGLCNAHYQRLRRGADMDNPIQFRRVNHGAVCTEAHCNAPYWAAGLCRPCYDRQYYTAPEIKARRLAQLRERYANDEAYREAKKRRERERYRRQRAIATKVPD